MAKANIAALTTPCNTSDGQSIDPIPGWYLQYAASLKEAPGSTEPPLREELFDIRFRELEARILSTPAQSFEGAIRQLQILASDVDACSADPEAWGEKNLKEFMHHLWLALFGVLTYTLPAVPQIDSDPHYHLANPGAEGFTLFRSLQEVMK